MCPHPPLAQRCDADVPDKAGADVLRSISKHCVCALMWLLWTLVCLFWSHLTTFPDFCWVKETSATLCSLSLSLNLQNKQKNTHKNQEINAQWLVSFGGMHFMVLSGGDPLAPTSWLSSRLYFTPCHWNLKVHDNNNNSNNTNTKTYTTVTTKSTSNKTFLSWSETLKIQHFLNGPRRTT